MSDFFGRPSLYFVRYGFPRIGNYQMFDTAAAPLLSQDFRLTHFRPHVYARCALSTTRVQPTAAYLIARVFLDLSMTLRTPPEGSRVFLANP